jgi:hypothetical protein
MGDALTKRGCFPQLVIISRFTLNQRASNRIPFFDTPAQAAN